MSEMQKQIITDITSMAPFVSVRIAEKIKFLMEAEIEEEILRIKPDVNFDDMDITEKLMLLEYISKTEEERKKERDEAIPFEDVLKEEDISLDDLRD